MQSPRSPRSSPSPSLSYRSPTGTSTGSPLSPRRGYFSQANTWSTFGIGERTNNQIAPNPKKRQPGPGEYMVERSDFNVPKYNPNTIDRYNSPYAKKTEDLLKNSNITFSKPPPVFSPPKPQSCRISVTQANEPRLSTRLSNSSSYYQGASKTSNTVRESVREMSQLIQQYHHILSESATKNRKSSFTSPNISRVKSPRSSSPRNNSPSQQSSPTQSTPSKVGVMQSPRQISSGGKSVTQTPSNKCKSPLSPRGSSSSSPCMSPEIHDVNFTSPISKRVHLINKSTRSGSSFPMNSTSSRFSNPSNRSTSPGPGSYQVDTHIMLSQRRR